MQGTTFDIKEFSINDGPGTRVTVFMKGCPLRCQWCHNPEGLGTQPQYNTQTRQLVGKTWTVEELVQRLNSYRPFFDQLGGGITFSGGEPSMQAEFLAACAQQLEGVHLLLDTSGYCAGEKFAGLARHFDAFYFDLKLADDDLHKQYTGVSNQAIHNNLRQLMAMGKDVTIRMPMIPYITDTKENLTAMADVIGRICTPKAPIHLLPYNGLAGGKYPIYGMEYPLQEGYTTNLYHNIRSFADAMVAQGYQVKNYVTGV